MIRAVELALELLKRAWDARDRRQEQLNSAEADVSEVAADATEGNERKVQSAFASWIRRGRTRDQS